MLLAFVLGLLISNFAIVVISSVGFVASQTRERIYVGIGGVAGCFSLVIGSVFLFGLDGKLPDILVVARDLTRPLTSTTPVSATWDEVRDRLHAAGLRWTPQRRTLVEVLRRSDGHVTGAELVERCRELDPTTTPSTVYRTLDVLEGLGYLSHHHGMDGREEFHVLPTADHGHLHCRVLRVVLGDLDRSRPT